MKNMMSLKLHMLELWQRKFQKERNFARFFWTQALILQFSQQGLEVLGHLLLAKL